ncbi:psaF [Amphidinium carterae]
MAVMGKLACVVVGHLAVLASATVPAFVPGVVNGPSMPSANSHQAGKWGSQQVGESFVVDEALDAPESATWSSALLDGCTLRWLAAGLVAGIVASASTLPAQAAIDTAPVTKMKNLKTGIVEVDQTKLSVKSWGHMEPCGTNKKFQKRIKDEAFKLKKRQDKYAKGSAAYAGVQEVIDQAKDTAKAYEGRWCGKKDGLPRVIATGEITRGGIVTPALMFLYTTGWIGYAGRSYLLRTKDAAKEIKIDVPLALTCMTSAFAWPVYSWQDITNGSFVAKDTEIRVQRMHMA